MKQYHVLLFDLDGTLSDPKIGITKSVQFALNKMGVQVNDAESLVEFIGPPLQQSFAEFYGFDSKQVGQAMAFYRERFEREGIFENEIYRGIPEVLHHLKKQNKVLVVATSKPTPYSKKIVNYFQLDQYFDAVVGSHLDGTRTSKADIIQYILDSMPYIEKRNVMMIGDRKHDIIGAHKIGIDSLGVLYGYGQREELMNARPTYIIDSIDELKHFFS